MMNSEHPSWKELLLWQTRELSPEEAIKVESHLKLCSECREQLAEADSAFEQIAWVDAEAERREKQSTGTRRSLPARVFRSHPAMASTASVLTVTLLVVTSLQWTPQARAESLLTKAVREQARDAHPLRFLKVKEGGFACSVALGTGGSQFRLASSGSAEFCDTVARRLSAAGRQWDGLLSAIQFQQWRHSLSTKKDTVHSSGEFVDVTTTADQGVLKETSLRLRLSDYQPVAGHYEFSGPEPFTFDVEEDHAAEEMAASQQALATRQSQLTAFPSDTEQRALTDPLDETEAQVRLALHQAQLDRNILLAVERQHGSIRVWGAVPAEADRTNAEAAFSNLAHVRVTLLTQAEEQVQRTPLPWSSYQGDDAPLAEQQLTAMFPEGGSERHQFQNEVDAVTRRIVGEAKSRDALLSLRSRLSTTRYDEPLHKAIDDLANSLHADTLALAGMLTPVTGTAAHARSVMNYQQAMQLYSLVHELTFMSQQKSHLQFSQAVSRTRRLLSSN